MAKKTPRGIRNNNPLNIRYVEANNWQGRVVVKKDREFEEFTSMVYGLRAAFCLLYNYINKGHDTIEKIISKWAPASENNTEAYIKKVCTMTGRERGAVINSRSICEMIALAGAMAFVECGEDIDLKYFVEGYGRFCKSKNLSLCGVYEGYKRSGIK